VTGVEARADALLVRFEGKEGASEQRFDRILVAVGRVPNGRAIGAEAAGVVVSERGFIPVDKQQRTNVAHIYAIGDVVGQPMLAHKASHEGKVAAEVAAGHKRFFDARVIPSSPTRIRKSPGWTDGDCRQAGGSRLKRAPSRGQPAAAHFHSDAMRA